jgi:hypothetical protein
MIRAVSAPLYGDANDDGFVNALDFNALASHFSQTGQTWITGDFNQDGLVNGLDFNALASNFGQTPSAGPAIGSNAVPNPRWYYPSHWVRWLCAEDARHFSRDACVASPAHKRRRRRRSCRNRNHANSSFNQDLSECKSCPHTPSDNPYGDAGSESFDRGLACSNIPPSLLGFGGLEQGSLGSKHLR